MEEMRSQYEEMIKQRHLEFQDKLADQVDFYTEQLHDQEKRFREEKICLMNTHYDTEQELETTQGRLQTSERTTQTLMDKIENLRTQHEMT